MRGLLVSAAAIAFAAPALADGVLPIPDAYNWTGLYAGGQLGWAWSQTDTTTTRSTTGAFVGSATDDRNSFRGGGQIGYDFMTMPGLVVGGRATFLWGSSSTTTNSNAAGTNVSTSASGDDIGGTVNARLGYAFGDFLPYATGGWAWADGDSTRTQVVGVTGLATPGTVEQESVFRNGWNIGGGTRIPALEQLDRLRRIPLHPVRIGQRDVSAGAKNGRFIDVIERGEPWREL